MTALTFIDAYFNGNADTIKTYCLADPNKYLSENNNEIEVYTGTER